MVSGDTEEGLISLETGVTDISHHCLKSQHLGEENFMEFPSVAMYCNAKFCS
uniref:Uncharacterized protein n=1 Tax=Trichinella nativa TaxID=6335 RepID=A0A0V1KIW7_9BILA